MGTPGVQRLSKKRRSGAGGNRRAAGTVDRHSNMYTKIPEVRSSGARCSVSWSRFLGQSTVDRCAETIRLPHADSGSGACTPFGTPSRLWDAPASTPQSEFESKAGPLRFQNFHLFNRAEFDYDLLEKRIAKALERLGGLVDRGNVHHYRGNTNERIDEVLNSIPSWSYLFVFADIEGPSDLEFETLRALRGRHRSVDLYVLFPTGFIERVISYKPEQLAKHKELLDRFFGTDTWLQIVGKRFTPSQAREMRAELLKLYQKQLRTIWKHADVVMPIRKDGQRILYHMIFAHDHPTARKILNWASSKLQQLDLFGRPRG